MFLTLMWGCEHFVYIILVGAPVTLVSRVRVETETMLVLSYFNWF